MTSSKIIEERQRRDEQKMMFTIVVSVIIILLVVSQIIKQRASASTSGTSAAISQYISPILNCFYGKQGMIFVTMIYLFVVMNYAFEHQNTFYKSKWFFLAIIILPMFLIGQYVFMGFDTSNPSNQSYYILIGIVAGLLGFYLFLSNFGITPYMILTTGYFLSFLLILIILIGMSIAHTIFLEKAYDSSGFAGFIAGLIFFIPCMIRDFLNWISLEITGTPISIYFIFIIEILLILAYFYIPKIYKKVLDRGGKTILEDAVPLTGLQTLSNYVEVFGDPMAGKDLLKSTRHLLQKTFAVSFWVYPMSNPTAKEYREEKQIFSYGGNHPKITYLGKDNVFYFYYGEGDKRFDFTLPMQKWNHIAINYTLNSIDLFVNGKLIRSHSPRAIGKETHTVNDNFQVGDENGVGGGIRKVVVYKDPLSQQEISTIAYLGIST